MFRLLKGLIYTAGSIYAILHEEGNSILGHTEKWVPQLESYAKINDGTILYYLAQLCIFAIYLVPLIYLVKGVYFIFTCNLPEADGIFGKTRIGEFWDALSENKGNSEEKHIERIKGYRDSKLGMMGNEEAAKEYKKTAWIDGVTSGGGKNTERTKGYVNSKLGNMSNEGGYEWLKK